MGKKRIIKEKVSASASPKTKDTESLLDKKLKSKKIKGVKEAYLYIFSSYNNTILNLTTLSGDTIFQISTGQAGFSGTKKGTHYAGSKVAETMSEVIKSLGIEKVNVRVKGVGPGRDAVLRMLASKDVNIVSISDITPVPHDGCRPPKVRKV